MGESCKPAIRLFVLDGYSAVSVPLQLTDATDMILLDPYRGYSLLSGATPNLSDLKDDLKEYKKAGWLKPASVPGRGVPTRSPTISEYFSPSQKTNDDVIYVGTAGLVCP